MAATIRCAVIGCGVIGPVHLKCLQAMPGVETTWVCDLDENKARAAAKEFGVPNATTDAAAVFAAGDVDAVHICTDHASHAALTVAALAAGKHVLCEKPLASTREGVQAMLEAQAGRPDRILMPVFQHRFEPVMRALRAILDAGLLGKLVTATTQLHCYRSREYYSSTPWRGTWAGEGGSVLINQAVHFFDILLYIVRGATAVQAMWANRAHEGSKKEGGIETEDTLTATLQLKNGALATFQATNASHLDWDSIIALHGTEGSVDWRAGEIVKMTFKKPEAEASARKMLGDAAEAAERARREGVGKGYYGPGHPAQIADFIEAVQGEHPPYITPDMAAETMDALFSAYESASTGKRVEFGPDGCACCCGCGE